MLIIIICVLFCFDRVISIFKEGKVGTPFHPTLVVRKVTGEGVQIVTKKDSFLTKEQAALIEKAASENLHVLRTYSVPTSSSPGQIS